MSLSLEDLERITEVYKTPENTLFKPVAWPVSVWECVRGDDDSVVGYRMNPLNVRYIDSLPDEFFNHQIADLDTDDEEAVRSFVSEWGFPFSPQRIESELAFSLFLNDGKNDAAENAIAQTDSLLVRSFDLPIGEFPSAQETTYPGEAFVISVDEIRSTVNMIKKTRCLMFDYIKNPSNDNSFAFMDFLLASVQYPLGFLYRGEPCGATYSSLSERGFLTQAIANQMVETINDEAPWHACVKCGKLFKRKQNIARKVSTKKQAYTAYCSIFCQTNRKKKTNPTR